jgi:hypothetical protein
LSDIATGLPRGWVSGARGTDDKLPGEDAMNTGSTRIFAGAGVALSMRGTAARGGLFRRMGRDGAWEALDNDDGSAPTC